MKTPLFKRVLITGVIFIFAVLPGNLLSRTKLTTLPDRSSIRIDLKNSRFTLVEEERAINLQKGRNHVEFAWANTYIDMSSIQFRCIQAPGELSVINVNYPPGESALYWEVYSGRAGPGTFRISYLISNIQRNISYEAIADREEKYLTIKTYFTLKNMSGERFKNANLEINFGSGFRKSFETGEAKKMLAAKFTRVPLRKKYIFDTGVDSRNVRMFYEIKNSKKERLGKFPLPSGKFRIFQVDSSGSEAFLGEDWGSYTPPGEKTDLYLGQAKEVKVKRFLYGSRKKYTEKPVKEIRKIIKYRIENFKKENIPLTLMEHPGGEWRIEKVVLKEERGERNRKTEKTVSSEGRIRLKRKDINNLKIDFNLPRTKKMKYNLYLHIVLKNRW
jgi:hypothetical protein